MNRNFHRNLGTFVLYFFQRDIMAWLFQIAETTANYKFYLIISE